MSELAEEKSQCKFLKEGTFAPCWGRNQHGIRSRGKEEAAFILRPRCGICYPPRSKEKKRNRKSARCLTGNERSLYKRQIGASRKNEVRKEGFVELKLGAPAALS